MGEIRTALDALVGDLASGLPAGTIVTRDPAQVRAGLARAGVCVFVRTATPTARTSCGWQLDVPVSVVMPTTDSLADNDRAYDLLELVIVKLKQNQAIREPVTLGPDLFPAYTITAQIGA